jgi:hypothetical protein
MSQSTTPPPLERQTALIERFTTASAQGWQQAWDWWSERSNPIVVKEARQSLNSNQFVICFGITLVAVLLWTMYSVFSQLPNAYYLPGGLLVLTGYFVILSFPLILVIPFSAYRSMMLEAESRTFELSKGRCPQHVFRLPSTCPRCYRASSSRICFVESV